MSAARRVLDVFDLQGRRVLRYEANRAEGPPAQIRAINMPENDPDRDRIRSVVDADRLGRGDLVRCFLLDSSAEPWCYREQVGGHDRLPEITAPEAITEMRRDWSSDPDWGERHREVYLQFPEGEISGLRAAVLAWLERDGRIDWKLTGAAWGLAVVNSGAAQGCANALHRVGYLEWTEAHCWDYSGALAAMPRLYARLQELRAAKASPAPEARP